jgi:succinyl-diaminopimelate desuccinylase
MTRALALTEQLIARRSVTPDDGGCQALIAELLGPAGFECRHLPSGPAGAQVQNLWALRRGSHPQGPLLVLAAHTDVVPTGPLAAWTSDPFVPTHRGGHLYGRGAADMKTSLAAMTIAALEFAQAHPKARGAVALLLTSDEEGVAVDGTVKVVQWLSAQGIAPDYCIVGEPTSVNRIGDTIKNGRRGTLSGRLEVKGVQGHIAYPHLASNPIHRVLPALAELAATEWDRGNAHFPPTSFQISNIHAGTGANNVTPGSACVDFNFRFSTESNEASLKARVHDVLRRHEVPFELTWTLGGEPFLTPVGKLSIALTEAIREHCGCTPELSTTGGTSDGRFIARICPQVIEFGPVNASIHKVDENVDVASIEPLKNVYRSTMERLLT